MQTQTVSVQHKTNCNVLVQCGPFQCGPAHANPDCLYNTIAFSVDHFQAVYNTSSPGNTGIHRQYTVHVSVKVYATFAHSVVGLINGLLCTSLYYENHLNVL